MLQAVVAFFGGGFILSGLILLFAMAPAGIVFLIPGLFFSSWACGANFLKDQYQTDVEYVGAHFGAWPRAVGVFFAGWVWLVFATLSRIGAPASKRAVRIWILEQVTRQDQSFIWDMARRKFYSTDTGKEIPLASGIRPPGRSENPERAFTVDPKTKRMVRAG